MKASSQCTGTVALLECEGRRELLPREQTAQKGKIGRRRHPVVVLLRRSRSFPRTPGPDTASAADAIDNGEALSDPSSAAICATIESGRTVCTALDCLVLDLHACFLYLLWIALVWRLLCCIGFVLFTLYLDTPHLVLIGLLWRCTASCI